MSTAKNTILWVITVFLIANIPYIMPENVIAHFSILLMAYTVISFLLMKVSIYLEWEFGI